MTIKTTFIAGVLAAMVGTTASATTIINGGALNVGDDGLGNAFLAPGGSVTFTYTATQALRVLDFVSVSSTGLSSADLLEVSYGYTSADVGNFTSSYVMGDVTANGASFEAGSSISGFTMEAGDMFTLFFNYSGNGVDTISNQYRFDTAPVPLPAGILLLGTALGGLGIARRRKTATAA